MVALELITEYGTAVETLVAKEVTIHIVGGRNGCTLPRKVIFTDLSEDKIMRSWLGKKIGGFFLGTSFNVGRASQSFFWRRFWTGFWLTILAHDSVLRGFRRNPPP
ncbi:MAG TPA: hypothetical protein VKB40_13080 [Candidatus Acidoferrales bacterium]|nr:hypothetical protein [Candidatus Acidoferrales bacterium]